jgi:CheY-like chemotaxis protein
MDEHVVPPLDRLPSPSSRNVVSASAPTPQPLFRNVSMLADENVAEGSQSAPVPPPRSRRRRGQRRRGRGPQATILVVDDEEPVRETLVELLTLQGFRVVTAENVEQAEATRTQLGSGGIQLLITDVNLMPGAQARPGYAMALRWRAIQPDLPILLISGDPSNADLPEVRDGSLGFLPKPFHMDGLLEAVRRALGR